MWFSSLTTGCHCSFITHHVYLMFKPAVSVFIIRFNIHKFELSVREKLYIHIYISLSLNKVTACF